MGYNTVSKKERLKSVTNYRHDGTYMSLGILGYAMKSEQACIFFFLRGQKSTQNMLHITFHVHSNRKEISVFHRAIKRSIYVTVSILVGDRTVQAVE